MKKILRPEFFNRPTLTVAQDLIGKFLVRSINGKDVALMITETEAYDGFHDLASHAHRGKTVRNTPMFGEPGTIYVYFTYGIHWMLNLVCGEKEYPAAVLIRGLESVVGPARLTKFLKIDKSLNAKMLGKKSGLWVEDRGVKVSPKDIARTPRIGINYAGKYVHKPWRFVLKSALKKPTRKQ
jgi:DNA-3-methyladenine glycosylase